jgi:hypothetical protein
LKWKCKQLKGKNMKKFCMVLSLAGVMVAPNLFASMSVTLLDNTSSYSHGNGGEFRAVGNPGLDSIINWGAYSSLTKGTIGAADTSSGGYNSGLFGRQYFQTFCIQSTVDFTPGNSYSVVTGPAITIGTAYLYSRFAAGSLNGYTYTYGSGRSASAGLLQQAIWWLQGQTGGVDNSFVTAAGTTLGMTAAQLQAAANGAYGVVALDLSGCSGPAQDQLAIVVVPEPTTVVAGALLLLPFGASVLRILRKRTRTV